MLICHFLIPYFQFRKNLIDCKWDFSQTKAKFLVNQKWSTGSKCENKQVAACWCPDHFTTLGRMYWFFAFIFIFIWEAHMDNSWRTETLCYMFALVPMPHQKTLKSDRDSPVILLCYLQWIISRPEAHYSSILCTKLMNFYLFMYNMGEKCRKPTGLCEWSKL